VDPAAALVWLGGFATWGQLLQCCTAHAIRSALRRGVIVRLRRGRYGLPAVADHRREAHRRSAVLSHLSAAAAHGWAVAWPATQPWITVPRKRHLVPGDADGLHVVYRDLDADDVEAGVTSRVRTVIDCAMRLPFPEALTVADSALRSRSVRPDELEDAASLLRGIGAPAARRVVRTADARAANPFESVLRAICLEFPELEMTPQMSIAADGIWAVVDLGDARLRLVIEAEGFEFHGTRKGLVRDCRRYTELTVLGWTILRFTWEDVMLHPDHVRWAIRTWLTQREPAEQALAG
jgi:very-short-patch-repair endonuclease